ncbi:MAG: alpha-glucosidase/alpha-galactosidase [Candidatus Bathyarchaeota archaeon]|nr:alpha-glucosidase/alpha-galactosidase [Candidatus Bathyarchaeota archaeon]
MGNRIVLVGAGSAVFGYNSVLDAANLPGLKGSNLVLHDIDEGRLHAMAGLAERMNEETGAGLEIEETTDRGEALDGADFVVLSIAVDRMRRWRLDWEVPFKHGIKQVIGENGGPGGLFHTMRMVPPVLDICHGIELHCPDALLLNYTNPVPRLCLAMSRYTGVKAVGLCHEVEHEMRRLAPIIGVPTQLLDATSAGLNHFSWFKELRLKNGEDAYPLLEKGLRDTKGFQPLCRALYKRFGLYPSTDDNHAGEYLAYAWEACPPRDRGLNWIDRMEAEGQEAWGRINRLREGKERLKVEGELSGEAAMRIIEGIITNSGHTELQVNLPNEGQVTNLLPDAFVETPAVINRSGVHPIHVGELPQGLAAICNIQILIQNLVVDAAVHGDKKKALQALLADPVVQDNVAAEKAFNELLEAHRDLLPQFEKTR